MRRWRGSSRGSLVQGRERGRGWGLLSEWVLRLKRGEGVARFTLDRALVVCHCDSSGYGGLEQKG